MMTGANTSTNRWRYQHARRTAALPEKPRPERDDTIAEITDDALIALDEHVDDSPLWEMRADGGERSDGWDDWALRDDAEPPRMLRELADDHRLARTV